MDELGRPVSLDGARGSNAAKEGPGDLAEPLAERLGTTDAELDRTEQRVCVEQLLRQLSEPLQRVIHLRYLAELSQREVARRLGLSQMQVCRMEKRALTQLRDQVAAN